MTALRLLMAGYVIASATSQHATPQQMTSRGSASSCPRWQSSTRKGCSVVTIVRPHASACALRIAFRGLINSC